MLGNPVNLRVDDAPSYRVRTATNDERMLAQEVPDEDEEEDEEKREDEGEEEDNEVEGYSE